MIEKKKNKKSLKAHAIPNEAILRRLFNIVSSKEVDQSWDCDP